MGLSAQLGDSGCGYTGTYNQRYPDGTVALCDFPDLDCCIHSIGCDVYHKEREMKKPERPSGRIIWENKPMNPKIFWSIVIIGIVLIAIMSLSCEKPYGMEEVGGDADVNSTGRFVVMHQQNISTFDEIKVIRDKETGVEYLIFKGYKRGGICKLEGMEK